jgi:hypothetical protein
VATNLPTYENQVPGLDIDASKIDLPGYESPTKGFDFAQGQYDAALSAQGTPAVNGNVPDPAKGLLELGGNQPVPEGYGLNDQGKLVQIPQGDAPGPTDWTNSGAPPAANTQPVMPDVSGTPPTANAPTPSPLAAEGTSAAQSAATGGGSQFATNVSGQVDKLQAPTSIWSDLFGFVQKNQTLSYGAIQAVGSFISGALKPGTDQSLLDELSSRQQQNLAAANLYNQQAAMLQRRMENMTNLPVASRQPRAPTPGYGLAGYGVTGNVS